MTDFWQFLDTYLIVIWQIYVTDRFLTDFWQLNDTFTKITGPQKYMSTLNFVLKLFCKLSFIQTWEVEVSCEQEPRLGNNVQRRLYQRPKGQRCWPDGGGRRRVWRDSEVVRVGPSRHIRVQVTPESRLYSIMRRANLWRKGCANLTRLFSTRFCSSTERHCLSHN